MPVNGIRLLAHRCAPRGGPENTLEALRRCRDQGADAVEVDVQLTADGEPVLFHDADLGRLTGEKGAVARLPWREVRRLRVHGRWPVPHLTEALAFMEGWPEAELVVDLHQDRACLAAAAARAAAASAARSRVSILAFDSRRHLLLAARAAVPEVRLSVMPGPPWRLRDSARALRPVEACLGWDGALTRVLYRAACAALSPVPAIRAARAAGLKVSGGVANSASDVAYFVSQGVDGVWTDDLGLCRAALEAG